MPRLPNLSFLDEMTEQLSQLLPSDIGILKKDIEKAVDLAMQSALGKLDLVTREEFDVQCAVLERTRAKLNELEQIIDSLDAQD